MAADIGRKGGVRKERRLSAEHVSVEPVSAGPGVGKGKQDGHSGKTAKNLGREHGSEQSFFAGLPEPTDKRPDQHGEGEE